MRITAVSVAAVLAMGQAVAAGQTQDEPIIEKLEHGEINWTDKSVLATGSGAPNLELANVAAIRLNAERAAKLDAFRNVIETLQGVRVSGALTGKEALAKAQVRAQVEGIVRGCKVVDTRYFSDGGVDVVLRCELDGGLATSLAPVRPEPAAKSDGDSEYTGLVVDATGLPLQPALQPRILDSNGEELYSARKVSPNALRQFGAASFVATVEAAKQLERLGKNPLVLTAAKLGEAPSDVVVNGAEALKGGRHPFLADARVVIVTDRP